MLTEVDRLPEGGDQTHVHSERARHGSPLCSGHKCLRQGGNNQNPLVKFRTITLPPLRNPLCCRLRQLLLPPVASRKANNSVPAETTLSSPSTVPATWTKIKLHSAGS